MQNVVILKNWPVKGLCGRYLSVWGLDPHTPPLTHCICIYSTLIHTGKGGSEGRVKPERRGEGQQFTKLGRKYQHDLQTINSAKYFAV
jgi:hypothetical protein